MKKIAFLMMFLLTIAGAASEQQAFEHDAVLVENRSTAFVVRATGYSAEKKKAAENAAMSALDTYLFVGIEGVNGGKPLLAECAREQKPGYFSRLYDEGRYSVFARVLTEKPKAEKQPDGRFLTTVEVAISFKALQRDIATSKLPLYGQEQVVEKPAVDALAVEVPRLLILPDLSQQPAESCIAAIERDANVRMAMNSLAAQFTKRGVEVVDYKNAYDSYMLANPGTDAASAEAAVLGQCATKAVVLVSAGRKSQYGSNGVTIGVKAVDSATKEIIAREETSTRLVNTDNIAKLFDFASVRVMAKFIPAMKEALAQRMSKEQDAMVAQKPVPVEENLDPIDVNLPKATEPRDNTFAVVIGNEDYKYVAAVPFAARDAAIFAKYCSVTLGLPDDNIRLYTNATYGDILDAIDDIKTISEVYNGDIRVIFYYAGHGVPDEATRNAYLLPVDARSQQLKTCYPIEKLYAELGSLKAHSVTLLLDACFSGSQRGDGMLMSARGVALKPRTDEPKGNMVAISAATGEETAYPYAEKRHGMFTYYLLSKLQESGGDVTLGELCDYITTKVSQQSVKVNRKQQTPTVMPSPEIETSWRTLPLR
ncbi:MAG: DUF6175 family protein [Muribaculaceae bacterium]|nr:DUF6175 family protein [Muribaculaceae bacterium]